MITLSFDTINWLTILVGAVIYMVVGGLWYGPIAGKAWMKEMGLTAEDIQENDSPAAAMVKSFIAALVMSFGLAWLFAQPAFAELSMAGGAVLGVFITFILVGGATFPNYAFEEKSLKHFLIHIGNTAVAMALIGAMMAVWR